MSDEERISKIKAVIGVYPDYPKPGINFRDIFPVLRNAELLEDLVALLVEQIKNQVPDVDVIVGLEARGFLFGPLVAQKLGIGFVPIRKKGKLPGECCQVSYTLEYGTDVFEAQKDSIKPGQKVVIIDDLLATGGTMSAACQLVEKLKGRACLCVVVIELVDLKGSAKFTIPSFSLVQI
ncbi:adenine phosphoribosyltransferase-like [Anneissia japonica]|uniref:adenine phosphoribosyltransferase-like n=1 Tax=Anneissia japonica TaxID=1529436 RepID=UPI001425906F|nr:adenine phosphoribosyltransferase-like [Anneissia japonica]